MFFHNHILLVVFAATYWFGRLQTSTCSSFTADLRQIILYLKTFLGFTELVW